MRLYKLTDEHDRTYGGTQWGEGVTHTAPGKGPLCSAGWIHAYTDPLLAVMLNPIHGDFSKPHLWEAEGVVGVEDHDLKVGCESLTTVRRMKVPRVTQAQRVRFGVLCALEVYRESHFVARAEAWLSGSDRTEEAAWEAAEAAAWAARASNTPLNLAALAKRAIEEEKGK